jgi:hypothetical protein
VPDDAMLCPCCGSSETLILIRTMLRVLYIYICHAGGKMFAILVQLEPTDMTSRQRGGF